MKKVIEINDINPVILSGPNDENIKLIEKMLNYFLHLLTRLFLQELMKINWMFLL